jgi:hypothetical protein
MRKFAVHLHGTACWLGVEERSWGESEQTPPRPMGFYTVRFVEAASKDEAAAQAVEMVHAEVESMYRDGYSRSINVEEVCEDEKRLPHLRPGLDSYGIRKKQIRLTGIRSGNQRTGQAALKGLTLTEFFFALLES